MVNKEEEETEVILVFVSPPDVSEFNCLVLYLGLHRCTIIAPEDDNSSDAMYTYFCLPILNA